MDSRLFMYLKNKTKNQKSIGNDLSAQGWCTGKPQWTGLERAGGGGIRMGNTCKPMADSCQCMAKTTTIL